MDRRAFTAALAGLGIQVVVAPATTVYKPAATLADDLLPSLRPLAKLPSPQCVEAAMPVLLPIGDPIPLLIDLLADDDPEMRLLAIDVLGELQPDVRSFPGLIAALDDPDPLVRVWAASLVVEFGARAKAAIPALERWFTSDASMTVARQEWFRVTAADTIVRIDSSRTDVLPVLLEVLESRNPLCQFVAAEALGDLGAAVALPMLRRLQQDEPNRECFGEADLVSPGPAARNSTRCVSISISRSFLNWWER